MKKQLINKRIIIIDTMIMVLSCILLGIAMGVTL